MYIFKRIFKMNYKNFFMTIDKVHKRSGKNKILLFFDMIICGIKYQCGYVDYLIFEFYNTPIKYRKTLMTRGANNKYVKLLNDKAYTHYFHSKIEFNDKFSDFLNREWLLLENIEEFKKFIKNKKEIIVKPISGSCGVKIEKIKIDNKTNVDKLYKQLMDNKQILIEEVAKQHKDINQIYEKSINTCRIVTVNINNKPEVVISFLRIGNNNNVVDNFNHGGLVGKVDVETGTIKWPAIDKSGNVFDNHPMTHTPIKGFTIPNWENAKKLVLKAAKIVPEVRYVGWDVCIGEDKPFLIEGNEFPGYDIYELPVQKDGYMGMKPTFEKLIKKINK